MNLKLKLNLDNLERLTKALVATNGYCPCRFPQTEQNLCVCEAVMNGEKCICGLFQVEEEK